MIKKRIPKKRPTDWRKRFGAKKEPKRVVLETDFAGIKSGTIMFVATPGLIANYIARIPSGERRTIERMRNELARKNGAAATCPVSTAIFLRVVAEASWDDLQDGKKPNDVIPFWRVITADSTIGKKLRCGPDWLNHQQALEAGSAKS